MRTCPNCSAEYDETLDRCPSCGAEAAPEHHCERCESVYQGGDSCPRCGLLLAPVPCPEHPDRAAGSRCVICARAVCDECRVESGLATLCPEHRTVQVIENWAQVYSTTTEFEAQLLCDNLRAEGLDAQIYSQKDRTFNVDLGELSIVRLLVPVWEYEQALHVIRSHMDTEGEVVFACPACGEAYDPGNRECTACGGALV